MTISPSLSYLGFEVLKAVFDRGDFDKFSSEADFIVNVQLSNIVNKENKNDFVTNFIITITHPEFELFNFQVEAFGKFYINGEVDEKTYFNFSEISAPSIVYPYLRAYISTVAIQSGLNPLFIPPLNFINKRSQNSSQLEG